MERKVAVCRFLMAITSFAFGETFYLEADSFGASSVLLQLTYKITASARVIVSLFKFISFWF
jgi:hypothetical protein